jgi:hypothetical protein
MTLERHPDPRRVGEVLGRHTIKADRGIDFREMDRGGDGQRPAHAEAGDRDPAAMPLEGLRAAAQILVRGVRKIEALHQVVGLIGGRRQTAAIEIGSQRIVAEARQAVGDAADLVVETPTTPGSRRPPLARARPSRDSPS